MPKLFSRLNNIKTATENFLAGYKAKDPATYAAAQQAIGAVLILDGLVGIDNPLQGKKRNGIFGSFFGILFGLVFAFAPMLFGNMFGINKMTAKTTATVVSVSQSSTSDSGNSCSATVHYSVNSQEYTQHSSYGSSSFCSLTSGETIQISYDPNQPGKWGYDLKLLSNLLMIFIVAGVLIALTSLVTFIIRLLSIYFGWKLLKSGRALARSLPAGTDLGTVITEIKEAFTKHLFSFGPASSLLTPVTQTGPVAAIVAGATAKPPAAQPQPAAGQAAVQPSPADPPSVQIDPPQPPPAV